jgi:hypothetical protein
MSRTDCKQHAQHRGSRADKCDERLQERREKASLAIANTLVQSRFALWATNFARMIASQWEEQGRMQKIVYSIIKRCKSSSVRTYQEPAHSNEPQQSHHQEWCQGERANGMWSIPKNHSYKDSLVATKILWWLPCFPLLVVVALASIHPSQEKCASMENQGPLSHPLLDFWLRTIHEKHSPQDTKKFACCVESL